MRQHKIRYPFLLLLLVSLLIPSAAEGDPPPSGEPPNWQDWSIDQAHEFEIISNAGTGINFQIENQGNESAYVEVTDSEGNLIASVNIHANQTKNVGAEAGQSITIHKATGNQKGTNGRYREL